MSESQPCTILLHEGDSVGGLEARHVEAIKAAAGFLGFTPNDLVKDLEDAATAIQTILGQKEG